MIEKELDHKYIYLKMEDGILVGAYKEGLEIDLDIAKEIVSARLEFTDSVPCPGLIDDRGVKSMNKEARDYFSSEKGIEGVSAAGVMSRSLFSRLLINFFIKITGPPPMPVQSFVDESKAIAWLKQFR